MSKPDANLWNRLSNVIIVAGDGHECEWEVVTDNENSMANSHIICKCPIIALVLRQILLLCPHQISDIILEVQANKSG